MKKKKLIILNISTLLVGFLCLIFYNIQAQNPANTNRDLVIAEIQNMTLIARQHFSKVENKGGGNNTFSGWQIPKKFSNSKNAKYDFEIRPEFVKIKAIGLETGFDNKNPVQITAEITYSSLNFIINN